MATTFRADIGTGIYTVLASVAVAHPSLLARAFRAKPSSVGPDMPSAYVDSRPEGILHDSGTRTRTMTPSAVIVHAGGDNLEVALALDQLVDVLVDAFTAVPQLAPGTIWSRLSVSDEEVAVGDYLFPAVRLSWPDITIMEGRS